MDVQIRARLGATRLALSKVEGESHRVISAAQLAALKSLITRDCGLPSCTDETRDSLMEMASSVAWYDGHLEEALKCLKVQEEGAVKKAPRRPMQHFAPGIVAYFTEAEWAGPLKEKGGIAMSDLVLDRIVALSGRNLAEVSLKFVASFLMYLTHEAGASQWTRQSKKDFFTKVKQELKRRVRNLDDPSPNTSHSCPICQRNCRPTTPSCTLEPFQVPWSHARCPFLKLPSWKRPTAAGVETSAPRSWPFTASKRPWDWKCSCSK